MYTLKMLYYKFVTHGSIYCSVLIKITTAILCMYVLLCTYHITAWKVESCLTEFKGNDTALLREVRMYMHTCVVVIHMSITIIPVNA